VLNVATPELLSVAVPIGVKIGKLQGVASRKVTVPLGVPAEEEVTVAVKVTALPKIDGFALDVSAVEVESVGPDASTLDVKRLEPLHSTRSAQIPTTIRADARHKVFMASPYTWAFLKRKWPPQNYIIQFPRRAACNLA
jgi:hypothetical protein